MRSIAARLERLEAQLPQPPCPACGLGAGGPTHFTIVTDEISSPFYRPTALPEPTRCAVCGRDDRPFTINLVYGDDDEDGRDADLR